MKDNLFKDEKAIGKFILIHGIPFQVIGVLKPKLQNSDYSGRDHSKAIMPLTTFMMMYNRNTMKDNNNTPSTRTPQRV